jgi:hypothetical protein
MSGPEPQMPSDCLPVQALDPYTRGRWNVYLRQGKIKQLARQRGRALELA